MPLADKYPRLRRLSPLLLVLAAVVIYFGVMAPNVAEDHEITLELQGPVHEVTRVDVLWTGINVRPDEAVGGSTFHFEPGSAPTVVNTRVHAPNGDYWLDVNIERRTEQVEVRRRIALSASRMKVFVPF